METVIDKEWDILILLDACRYDYFKRVNPYHGVLTQFDQGCIGTKQYMQMNFQNRDCSNIVFINHLISFKKWLDERSFYKVIYVDKVYWDNNFGAVFPEPITKVALEAIKKYPTKRFVVHYQQPHLPFLDRGREIVKLRTKKEIEYTNNIIGAIAKYLNRMKNIFPPIPFWYLEKLFGKNAGIGEIFFDEGWDGLKKSYTYNINRVLKAVEEIVKLKNKKIVITSDHGKVIGEYLQFSHGFWKHKLVTTVPWFEVGNDN